jgi:uncharacterized membrane protein YcaP (DUF421 family)
MKNLVSHLIGGSAELGWVAIKAFLLYLTAVFGFRLSSRRALAEMSPFDFVAAVAVGAIVGRVPNSNTTSYLAGAVTLLTLLIAHRCITRLRQFPTIASLVDHSPRLLVSQGKVLDHELQKCGLTLSDLYGLLRQHGVDDLREVRYVIFEQRGQVSVIHQSKQEASDKGLVEDIVGRTSSQF